MKVIVTLTGPSCSGKTTLESAMIKNHIANRIVSHTTRQMRDGEEDKVHYHFVSEDEYQRLEGEMIQAVRFSDNNYGLIKSSLDNACGEDGVGVIVVTPEGVSDTQKFCDENDGYVMLSYFVTNSTKRLVGRMLDRLLQQEEPGEDISLFAGRIISLVQKEIKWGMGCSEKFYRETITLTDDQDSRDALDLIMKDISHIRCAYTPIG